MILSYNSFISSSNTLLIVFTGSSVGCGATGASGLSAGVLLLFTPIDILNVINKIATANPLINKGNNLRFGTGAFFGSAKTLDVSTEFNIDF